MTDEAQLDRVFAALVNPTRRSILGLLEVEADGLSVSGLAEPLQMKLPALLKHLSVLEEAALVRREKSGRTVQIHLAPESMAYATRWLQRYERFWSSSLDRLAEHAEAKARAARAAGTKPEKRAKTIDKAAAASRTAASGGSTGTARTKSRKAGASTKKSASPSPNKATSPRKKP